jgi:CheY-like chemotaxis protein
MDQAHILIVEDEPAFRRLVVRMVERAGYRVTHAEDYLGALKLVETDRSIALLLIDIGMPAGTPHGIAIAKMSQLRQSQLKVVYMTGGDSEQIAQHTDGAPVLQKPFTADQLATTLKSTLAAGD